MILIDANIWMYAIGAAHPHRERSRDFLRRVLARDVDAIVSVEVLHEILHRYRSVGRWNLGLRVYDVARESVPYVLPVNDDVLDYARGLLSIYSRLSTRDAVHAGSVLVHGLTAICSYDRDFDDVKGLTRIEP